MLVPGMQRFIMRCFRDMRFPCKCFGIESPIIRNVRLEDSFEIRVARGVVPSLGFEGLLIMVDKHSLTVDGADGLGIKGLLGSCFLLFLEGCGSGDDSGGDGAEGFTEVLGSGVISVIGGAVGLRITGDILGSGVISVIGGAVGR